MLGYPAQRAGGIQQGVSELRRGNRRYGAQAIDASTVGREDSHRRGCQARQPGSDSWLHSRNDDSARRRGAALAGQVDYWTHHLGRRNDRPSGDLCLRSAKGRQGACREAAGSRYSSASVSASAAVGSTRLLEAKARRGRTPVPHTLRAVRHNNPRARSRGAQPAVSCGFVGQPRRGKGGAPALVCGSWCRAVFLRPEVQELGTKEARSRIAPGLSSERTSGAGEGGAKPQWTQGRAQSQTRSRRTKPYGLRAARFHRRQGGEIAAASQRAPIWICAAWLIGSGAARQ